MIQKIKILTLFVSLLTLFTTCSKIQTPDREKQLIVAMDLDMPGYFTLNGETYGYPYELLQEYAKYIGAELKIVSENTPQAYQSLLASDKLDMAAMLKTHISEVDNTAIPIYNTSYVVLAGRKTAKTLKNKDQNIYEMLSGKKILVSHGFNTTESYDEMMDSLRNTETVLSSRNSFELIESLSEGDYDFLICEQSEAYLGCALVRNISQVYEFEEKVPVYMLFGKHNDDMVRNFSFWLKGFSTTDEYAALNELYFEQGIAGQIISRGLKDKSKGAISVYDDIFKKIGKQENFDWRMISAIAYNESKFNSYLVSPRGAKGLMQIMPSVARQFNVPTDSLMNPEDNVKLAVKLINKIERTLKIAPGTDFKNKMSIILACYNGGIGHVIDARRLARKYGANPDSWEDVARYLELKSDARYADDEVVTSGKFSGTPATKSFVSNVMNKYSAYCARVP